MGSKAVHERGELAFHDVIELVQGQADAVIGDAVLRKIVGANFFGAVAGFDLAAALGNDGGLLLLQFQFIESGAENTHGLGFIFDLRFLVLLGDDEAGRQVSNAYGGVGGVDGLTSGTGRAKGVDAQILRLDFDIDFVGFRKDGDGGGGSMNATLRFRGRDSLHAMHSAFIFQLRIDLVALNGRDDFLQSAEVRGGAFEDLDFPTLGFSVARIHAEEFAGEESGFITPGTRANLDEDVFFVVGVLGQKQELEFLFDARLALGELFFLFVRELAHFGVLGFEDHLAGAGQVLFNLLIFAVLGDDLLEFGVLLGKLLQTRGVVDDLGGGKLLGHFLVARIELIEFLGECQNGHGKSSHNSTGRWSSFVTAKGNHAPRGSQREAANRTR